MTSRYTSTSTLHNRDSARSSLFDAYTGDRTRASGSRAPSSASPAPGRSLPRPQHGGAHYANGALGGYGGDGGGGGGGGGGGAVAGAYRPATPNSRGQYSDAVLSELESQNDNQLEGMSAKVKMLKDITLAIGDEIRDSTALAEKMNDSFDNTRTRLRGTMNRMLRMAERTGVGWKAWAAFLLAVVFLFWYVWLS